jgi:predicted nucleic acid-binding protein
VARLIVAEPPAAYGRRPRLVVDASVLAAAVFAEAALDEAVAWMRGRALCAPHLLDYELANVALNKVRRRSITGAAAVSAVEALVSLDLERHAIAPGDMLELAVQYGITAYDAAYLWLAGNLQAPLATFDAALGAAAHKHLGGGSTA